MTCQPAGGIVHSVDDLTDRQSNWRDPAIVLVSELARRSQVDKLFMKGVAVGMGIPIEAIGTAHAVTDTDGDKLLKFIERAKYPFGPRSRRKPK